MYRRELETRQDGQGGAWEGTGSRARRQCACSVLLLAGFFEKKNIKPCS